jgi:metal-responsive CopG/Arc/MetJ family transcriptional regulator
MKVKTSVTLSEGLLATVDERARLAELNRSEFIEAALRSFIAQRLRDEQNARDLAIINQRAEALNKEATDVLAYQIPL